MDSSDTNTVGTNTAVNPDTVQGNVLTPQQKQQMAMYANQLMSPSSGPPANSWGSGLAEMARSAMGGYMQNKANPNSAAPFPGLSSLIGAGTGSAGAPMQLPSANGGSDPSPLGIFSGLFGTGQNNGS